MGNTLHIRPDASWQRLLASACFCAAALIVPALAVGQSNAAEVCPRAAAGSVVTAPQEIRSQNGVLQVALLLRSAVGPAGELRYCYVDEKGNQSPTLRLKPGELLILRLKNDLASDSASMNSAVLAKPPCISSTMAMTMAMQAALTNLHFHGLMIPPACHQDDVLNTMIEPGAPAYEYRFRIPKTQPPGLYWYHPHPHGHSEEQVMGGASGALIVEGIETFNHLLEGLPERILVIRDQNRPSVNAGDVPKDANGLKPPSHDLSVNFIPVPYPKYPPAIIQIRPSQRELWRVLNASADTFVDLRLLTNGKWQSMGLVSLDGVPLGYEENGARGLVEWKPNIPIPPGGRAEFLFDGPAEGGRTQVLTAGVDTVPFVDEEDPAFVATTVAATKSDTAIQDDDDYTPARWLLTIVAAADAPRLDSVLPKASSRVERRPVRPLASVRPTRQRKLYFSEKVLDPKNPRTSTTFYVTEEGHRPAPFNPSAAPNITVQQGDVEDWVVENRSQEAHTFHIHQTHFIVLRRDNKAVDENYLRDTVDLPYWDGTSQRYPSVKLRLDFRDPAIVGTFPYHCHILQHEDGGMMGTIRVVKRAATKGK